MEFKDILHSERIAKGYTLEELGERVGLKKSAIHKYETGLNSNPGRTLILKLAQALDVSPCYLLCGEKEVTITIEEAELLADFRRLNKDGRIAAIGAVKAFSTMNQYIEKNVAISVS